MWRPTSDSVKRQLKAEGTSGPQGEFGIGLLSFWTVGDELSITSTGDDRRAYQMVMRKGDPTYVVTPCRRCSATGARKCGSLRCSMASAVCRRKPSGISRRSCDRIRQTGVRINVVDRLARRTIRVDKRDAEGRLLHQLPALRTRIGDMYAELYLGDPSDSNRVALFRRGTRVIEDLALLDEPCPSRRGPCAACRATSMRRSSTSRQARVRLGGLSETRGRRSAQSARDAPRSVGLLHAASIGHAAAAAE